MKLGTFSWRNLVGSLLIVFGGLLCALVCLSVTLSSVFARLVPFVPLHPGPWWMVAASHLLTFAAGALWWRAGRWIRDKENGWWPLLYLAVGYASGVGGAMLQEKARRSAVTPAESGAETGQDRAGFRDEEVCHCWCSDQQWHPAYTSRFSAYSLRAVSSCRRDPLNAK